MLVSQYRLGVIFAMEGGNTIGLAFLANNDFVPLASFALLVFTVEEDHVCETDSQRSVSGVKKCIGVSQRDGR